MFFLKMKLIFLLLTVFISYCEVTGKVLPELIDEHIEQYRNRALTDDEEGFVIPSDIVFKLWTSLDKSVIVEEGKLNNVKINKGASFKIIIHGFQSSGKAAWVRRITQAYLKKGIYNVIEVDWGDLAGSWLYPESSRYTKGVGFCLGYLILDFHRTLGVQLEDFHLIAHSLGAHVSGYAGDYVYQFAGRKLGRISGLDPAGPLFMMADPNGRLDREDALFVDVIHTDGKKYGMFKTIGHVDFFPNGGRGPQPGCLFYMRDILTCSHTRAHDLWEESITSAKFLASECSNLQKYDLGLCDDNKKAIMGEMVDMSVTGNFYLNTNTEPPFARNGII